MVNLVKNHFFVEPNLCIRTTYRRGKARLSISNVTAKHKDSKTEQSIFVLGTFAVNFTREQLIKFVQLAPALLSSLDMLQKSKTLSSSSDTQFAEAQVSTPEIDENQADSEYMFSPEIKPYSTTITASTTTEPEKRSESLKEKKSLAQQIKQKQTPVRPTTLLTSALPQKRKANSPKDTATTEIKKKLPMNAMKKVEMFYE